MTAVEVWAIKAPDGLRIDTLAGSYDSCVHSFVEGDIESWDRYHDIDGYRCVRVSVTEIAAQQEQQPFPVIPPHGKTMHFNPPSTAAGKEE